MRRSALSSRTWRCGAPAAMALVALLAAAPVRAAFPGKPGPIAYSRVEISEFGDTGGLRVHGPREADTAKPLTKDLGDGNPSYSPDGQLIVLDGNHDPGESRGSHIYLINRDGSGIKRLTAKAAGARTAPTSSRCAPTAARCGC
ncbi:MAG TPA: hypothetical protein VFM94_00305 [Solirubrobacterales bacterium]|nr:hypothetical protein [Solirubrobacterales bacterium]